ncbi:hypothetical protein [Shouchella lonarensis]|uniref:hypothetical protein n=1 Tax=Shouchella lonarensis TaxID=1464122 RepID=UPI00114D3FC6|nr:hypothetical protein [Shouchella lonarensis]
MKKEVDKVLRRIHERTKFTTLYVRCPELCEQKRMDLRAERFFVICLLIAYHVFVVFSLFNDGQKFVSSIIDFLLRGKDDPILTVVYWGTATLVLLAIPWSVAKRYIDKQARKAYDLVENKFSLDHFKYELAEKEFREMLKNPKINERIIREHALPYLERKIKRKEKQSIPTYLSKTTPHALIAVSIALVVFLFDGIKELISDKPEILSFLLSAFVLVFVLIFGPLMLLGIGINCVLALINHSTSEMHRLVLLRKAVFIYLAEKDANFIDV